MERGGLTAAPVCYTGSIPHIETNMATPRKASKPKKAPILVIVHPGSACGSAEENLGRDNADFQRLEMQTLVDGWEGGVLVIDGELSSELDGDGGWKKHWKEWGDTVNRALQRAKSAGFVSERVMGDDGSAYNQEDAIVDLVKKHKLTPSNSKITLTGAWVHSEDGGGCVNSVREKLEALGHRPTVEDAMDLDCELEMDDEHESDFEEEEDLTPVPKRPRTR